MNKMTKETIKEMKRIKNLIDDNNIDSAIWDLKSLGSKLHTLNKKLKSRKISETYKVIEEKIKCCCCVDGLENKIKRVKNKYNKKGLDYIMENEELLKTENKKKMVWCVYDWYEDGGIIDEITQENAQDIFHDIVYDLADVDVNFCYFH